AESVCMSKAIAVSDTLYEKLEGAAHSRGVSVAELLADLAQGLPPLHQAAAMAELIGEQRKMTPTLSVRRMCHVVALGRATYYRARRAGHSRAQGEGLRRQLRRLALEWPAYGYRRLTHALRRRGVV